MTECGCTCPAQARDLFDHLEQEVVRSRPDAASTGLFDDRNVDVPGSGEPPD